jgi:nucleotide-binding universal stress UspA family protein
MARQPWQNPHMSEHGQLVVGVDGSEGADHALRWAVEEGQLRQAEVVAIMAWGYLDQRPMPGTEGFDPSYGADKARAALAAFVDRAVGDRAASVVQRCVCDLPARALLDAAREAGLLVVGARGLGGFRGLLLGSVSQRCAHLATVPLVIIREGASLAASDRVVVGVDGSATAAAALEWAFEEAHLRSCGLTVLNAWHDGSSGLEPLGLASDPRAAEAAARQLVEEMIDDRASTCADVQAAIVRAGAADALVQASTSASLLVVGNRGHGTIGGMLLGSVAQQAAHHARCPLALVPSTDCG